MMLTAWPDGTCIIAGGGKVGVELGTTWVLTLGRVGHAVALAAGLDRLQETVKSIKATRRETTDILVFKEHLQTKKKSPHQQRHPISCLALFHQF
jgi:hypothetical protein